jgi:hypothetical protein
MEQKASKDMLQHQCQIVQVACCECAKDEHGVLKATVMPRLAQDIARVKEKCAAGVRDSSDVIDGPRKARLVPNTLKLRR